MSADPWVTEGMLFEARAFVDVLDMPGKLAGPYFSALVAKTACGHTVRDDTLVMRDGKIATKARMDSRRVRFVDNMDEDLAARIIYRMPRTFRPGTSAPLVAPSKKTEIMLGFLASPSAHVRDRFVLAEEALNHLNDTAVPVEAAVSTNAALVLAIDAERYCFILVRNDQLDAIGRHALPEGSATAPALALFLPVCSKIRVQMSPSACYVLTPEEAEGGTVAIGKPKLMRYDAPRKRSRDPTTDEEKPRIHRADDVPAGTFVILDAAVSMAAPASTPSDYINVTDAVPEAKPMRLPFDLPFFMGELVNPMRRAQPREYARDVSAYQHGNATLSIDQVRAYRARRAQLETPVDRAARVSALGVSFLKLVFPGEFTHSLGHHAASITRDRCLACGEVPVEAGACCDICTIHFFHRLQ